MREARPVEAGAQQRRRLPPLRGPAQETRGVGQEVGGVLGPAVDAVLPQAVAGLGRHQAEAGELGVGLVVARHQGQRDVPAAAALDHLLDAVGPVAHPAQEPHHHQPGVADHGLDVEVHREVVGEVEQAGEAQAGDAVAQAGVGRGQRAELAVGGREHDDVARALAQVDGLAAVRDAAGLGRQEMHG